MPTPFSFFSLAKKPSTIPFKYYYNDWFNTLKNFLLPLLRQSFTSTSITTTTTTALLSSHLNLLLHHFISYYDSLDLAVTTDANNLPFLLYASWHNSLEKPFLFLGDLHPYTFTNLLRSVLHQEKNYDDQETETNVKSPILDRPWQVMMAWKDPSNNLMIKIDQIECGLRSMVPALMDRLKRAQARFAGRIAKDWVSSGRKKERAEVGEAMKMEMEELMSIFLDANRLRRSVISEIVGALNVYQGALFLDFIAQFLVGFKDPILLREFEGSKNASHQ